MADIIIFALLTLFFAIRLFRVLGQKTELESSPEEDVITPLKPVEEIEGQGVFDQIQLQWDPSAQSLMHSLAKEDPSFDPLLFQEGAMRAFKMITEAYTQGDLSVLSRLLLPSLFESFKKAIEERLEKGETLENQLISLKQMQVRSAHVSHKKAEILVWFISEQITVTRNQKKEIVSGTPNLIEEIEDSWTFSRPIGEEDPNWLLIKTK